jgi:hypothetical protein
MRHDYCFSGTVDSSGSDGCCEAGVPGKGAGGSTVVLAGVTTGTGAPGWAGRGAGIFGKYKGPGWPQPARIKVVHRNAKVDFTIRITD